MATERIVPESLGISVVCTVEANEQFPRREGELVQRLPPRRPGSASRSHHCHIPARYTAPGLGRPEFDPFAEKSLLLELGFVYRFLDRSLSGEQDHSGFRMCFEMLRRSGLRQRI